MYLYTKSLCFYRFTYNFLFYYRDLKPYKIKFGKDINNLKILTDKEM